MKKLSVVLSAGILVLAGVVSQAQLLNGDFEAGAGTSADNWTKYGGCSREGWANHGGANGMALTWWVSLTGGFYQEVAANAGDTFTLSAWYNDDAPVVATSIYSMKLEWLDNTTNIISVASNNVSPLLNNVWQQLSLVATAPVGAVLVRVVFDGDLMVSGETLKIDDVILTFTSPPGAPVITNQPAHKTVAAGANATFTVGVSNTLGVTYQWQLNNTDLVNGGNISGATGPTLTVTGVSASDVGHYRVKVTNVTGTVNSADATLQIVGINFYPVITIAGKIGDTNVVEYATALAPTTWIPLSTNVLTSAPQLVIDASSPGSNTRFYRAVYQP
jgi:hypothetical protein